MISLARPLPTPPSHQEGDALHEAWLAARRSREVPWEQGASEAWKAAFLGHILRARGHLIVHIEQSECEGSALLRLAARSYAAARAVERQFEDHRQLIGLVLHLVGRLEAPGPARVEEVIALIEDATLFEMRLAMHANRLNNLLAEAGVRAAMAPSAAAG